MKTTRYEIENGDIRTEYHLDGVHITFGLSPYDIPQFVSVDNNNLLFEYITESATVEKYGCATLCAGSGRVMSIDISDHNRAIDTLFELSYRDNAKSDHYRSIMRIIIYFIYVMN